MSELQNIAERLEKVFIVAPEPQAGILQQQRADIRYLLGVVVQQAQHIDSLTNSRPAA